MNTEPKTFERKPVSSTCCTFYEYWWNDPEQRNYTLERCKNKENTGGRSVDSYDTDYHDERTYSCWHKNEGMKHQCWGRSKEVMECEMALSRTQPEIKCEKFEVEKAHPKQALVLKEEIRERFYQADGLCASCQNCFEDS